MSACCSWTKSLADNFGRVCYGIASHQRVSGPKAGEQVALPPVGRVLLDRRTVQASWTVASVSVTGNPLVEVTVMSDRILVKILEEEAAPPPRAELVKLPDATPSPRPSGHTLSRNIPKDADIVMKVIAAYMRATQNGKPTSLKPYCRSILDNFYGKQNVRLKEAEKDIANYYKIWPNQTTSFDLAQCQVQQKSYDTLWYLCLSLGVCRTVREPRMVYHACMLRFAGLPTANS
jgi:hypothetical protein